MKVVLDVSHTDLISSIMFRYKRCVKDLLGDLAVTFLVVVLEVVILGGIVCSFRQSHSSVITVFPIALVLTFVIFLICRSWICDIWVKLDNYKQYRKLLSMGAKELHAECLEHTDTVYDYEFQFRLFKRLLKSSKVQFKGLELDNDGFYKVKFSCDGERNNEFIRNPIIDSSAKDLVLLLGTEIKLIVPKVVGNDEPVVLEDKGAYSFYLDR